MTSTFRVWGSKFFPRCRVQGSGPSKSDIVAVSAKVSAADAEASGGAMVSDDLRLGRMFQG